MTGSRAPVNRTGVIAVRAGTNCPPNACYVSQWGIVMRRSKTWINNSFNMWSLGMEAASVIALRSMQMAGGGAKAQLEGQRMVQEKFAALAELQMKAMTGALGFTGQSAATKTVAHYRRKVRANRKRLLKVK